MPKISCPCGASYVLTADEFRTKFGKRVRCARCRNTLLVTDVGTNVFTPAEAPLSLPRKQRSNWKLFWLCSGLLIAAVLSTGIWLLWPEQIEVQSPIRVKNVGGGIDAKEAVRRWLHENLDDPDFEEVKWWPQSPMRGSKRFTGERRMHFREEFWEESEENGAAIRLKFRSRNALGAKNLQDTVFLVDPKGTVYRAIEPIDFRLPGEKLADYVKRMEKDSKTRAEIEGDAAFDHDNEAMKDALQMLRDGGRKP